MMNYPVMYRLGLTPWERYGRRNRQQITEILEQENPGVQGRALDVGCGRGQFTPVLANNGWDTTGIDAVPAAIAAAQRDGSSGARYVLGDATALSGNDLGTFDLFVDIGCFQGFNLEQQRLMGGEVTAIANPGARLLMLAFGRSRYQGSIGGVSRQEIEDAFPNWRTTHTEAAPLAGLGWPMNRTSPHWYRLELASA